ncbi:MAG: transposase, partial [Bacteroidetes bacterium]
MPDWDYSGDGIYFITLVTRNWDCLFCKIENREMILSDFGEIAKNEYYRSFKIRRELTIDEFVIMPNHMHFIIIINKIVGNNHHVERNGRSSLRDDRDI